MIHRGKGTQKKCINQLLNKKDINELLVVGNSVYLRGIMSIKSELDYYYELYHRPDFIAKDPILLPHKFSKKEDIEIIGFFVALIAWGQRVSIIKSGERLIELFHQSPYDFIVNHKDKDLKQCLTFVHRTFNGDDLLSLIAYLKYLYTEKKGLEGAFAEGLTKNHKTVETALIGFREGFEKSEFALHRTLKHIASPAKGSACKRLNMYLRWMVRQDSKGIDFGIWKSISPAQLICPLDVHVLNQAAALGLIKEGKGDWKTAVELSNKLRKYDPKDPVKYDFALFGKGVNENS